MLQPWEDPPVLELERAQDFRTIGWGRAGAGAGGGKGIPGFLAFEGLRDLGVPIPPLFLPSGKPLAQGRRGTKLTRLSRPAHPRGFFGLCFGVFFGFTFPTLEI